MQPVDVQIREDAALGAAWRRAEVALPEHGHLVMDQMPFAATYVRVYFDRDGDGFGRVGDTPTAALEALAEALEARRAAQE